MIRRRHIATMVMSVGVLGKLDAAGAHTVLMQATESGPLSVTASAPLAEQVTPGPLGHLDLTTCPAAQALEVADGDDDDDGGHRHRDGQRDRHHGDDDDGHGD